MKNSFKSGVSLIAVLMFMLAATTASLVVFRWIAQENFASGSRLKGSEAYQASQAGLEATKGWLANKGADVGAILKIFEEQQGTKYPVRLMSELAGSELDLLAGDKFKNNKRQQEFEVYLTAAHTSSQPYKLKFVSIGKARDGSKHSQAGIFEVQGLYKVVAYRPPEPTDFPDVPAFYGGMSGNTQGKFESAIINGDANINGISTSGNLIVTGSLTTADNAQSRIGCKGPDNNKPSDNESAGDMYVLGNTNIRKFTVCGDAYVGGHMTAMGPKFLKGLYANGGITNNGGEGITVKGNLTLGGDYYLRNSKNEIDGNFVLEDNGYFIIQNDSKITIGGNVWSMKDLFKAVSGNKNDNNKYDELKLSDTSGKKLYIPNETFTPTPGKARICGNTSAYGCGGQTYRWYQHTINTDTAHFRIHAEASHQNPTTGNKPAGAKLLDELGSQIKDCGDRGKCIPDPLTVPKTGDIPVWKAPAQKLNTLVSIGDTANLPKACIRLVKSPENSNGNFNSQWCFGDGLNEVSNPSANDYPSMSGGYNFIKAANDCYAKLKQSDPKNILYPDSAVDASRKFLPLEVNPNEAGRSGYFDGNFIFYFSNVMDKKMDFPPTTNDAKVFIYFEKGATGNIPWTNSCVSGYCKRNYFIFSEDDIEGSSGSGTLNGALFLAKGAQLTAKAGVPDLTIEFNIDLYRALVDMGIVTGPSTSPPSTGGGGYRTVDTYHVPSTSHLKVKLESQYANEETISNEINAKPSIMVLPRVIYLKPEEKDDFTSNPQKYYKVLYMNGAAKRAEDRRPNCNISADINQFSNCSLSSESCDNGLCPDNPFYVVVTNTALAGGGGGDGGGGTPVVPGEEEITLYCSGIVGGDVAEGTRVNTPTLTCSNGAPPNVTKWISDAGPFTWWDTPSIPVGTFNNIRAEAKCGTGDVISSSCGSLTVTSTVSPELECSITNPTVAAGSNITTAIDLTCRNNNGNSGTHSNPRYSHVKSNVKVSMSSHLEAENYEDITVTADCGFGTGVLVTNLEANCGTLNVVGLTCNSKELYAKAGGTISSEDRPTLSCAPSGTSKTPDNFTSNATPNWTILPSWTVPTDAYSGLQYNITGNARCGILNSDLTADCGKVTVAGITCSGLPNRVQIGGNIPQPTLTCNNGHSNVTVQSYTINSSSSVSWSLPTTTAIVYNIEGIAHCTDDYSKGYLRGIPFTCPTVTVEAAGGCGYGPEVCNGMSYRDVETGAAASSHNTTGWVSVNNELCLFAASITSMGNNDAGTTILVNGQRLPGKTGQGNTEGRCGGKGTSTWESWQNNQLLCGDEVTPGTALYGIPKRDGGYYIYIPQGHIGQNFNITGGNPTGNCTDDPGGDGCACTTYCSPITCANLQVGSKSQSGGNGNTDKCYFFTAASRINSADGKTTINGKNLKNDCYNGTSNNCFNDKSVFKVDGGYYMFVQANGWSEFNISGGTNPCGEGGSSSSVDDGCAYQSSWCNNLYENAADVPIEVPSSSNDQVDFSGGSNGKCFFATNITKLCGSGIKVNDVVTNNVDCYSSDGSPPSKSDGGYYVYVPANQMLNIFKGDGGDAPNCDGGSSSGEGGGDCTPYVWPAHTTAVSKDVCLNITGACPDPNNTKPRVYCNGPCSVEINGSIDWDTNNPYGETKNYSNKTDVIGKNVILSGSIVSISCEP